MLTSAPQLKGRAVFWGRWILTFPVAIIGAWAGYAFFAYILHNFLVGWWIPPDLLIARILIVAVASIVMGVAFTIIGVKLAPSEDRTAAYVVCTFGVTLAALLAVIALLTRDWWGFGNLVLAGAACGWVGWQVTDWESRRAPN